MFTNIVVSTDENFLNFLPIVRFSWRKFFPKAKISVAFVTDRTSDDSVIRYIDSNFDNFKIYKPIEGYPTKNLAKISRFLFSSELDGEISMIEDVDTIPLQKDYFYNKSLERPLFTILAVGRECYSNTAHSENFPISTMTGEAEIFKELFNPNSLRFDELIENYENLYIDKSRSLKSQSFSDESFIRILSSNRGFDKFHHCCRNVDTSKKWIDRSHWKYDKDRLEKGEYVTCNFKRPLENHLNEFHDIIDYIDGENSNLHSFILKNHSAI